MDKKKVIVIGGGAAGYFSAINIAEKRTDLEVIILEKFSRLLSKVRISGGGRCNVTHHCFDNSELVKYYPRGQKELRQVFARFAVQDTVNWFSRHGVQLKTEEDGRMFPVTDTSETIISCLTQTAKTLGIQVRTNAEVFSINATERVFQLRTNLGNITADAVICAFGGHPNPKAYALLAGTGHHVVEPAPSLFTINLPLDDIKKSLQGISVPTASVGISKTKFQCQGPLLVTHWGLSGPAVLKLSAFEALHFKDLGYHCNITVNWVAPRNQQEVVEQLLQIQKERPRAVPAGHPQFDLPRRLWEYFCDKAGLVPARTWAETPARAIRSLGALLTNSEFQMQGKTTFKEEFVTCGGVDLKEIDFKTMQSKKIPGLFFCGEAINIDGVTGGFNFQNAWSTAYIAASGICDYI